MKYIVGGRDYKINDHITVRNPTMGEILEVGEERFLDDVRYTILRPYDAAVFLDDIGRDYRFVDNFELFYSASCRGISLGSPLFEGIDPATMTVGLNTQTEEVVLYQENAVIDKLIYAKIVEAVRAIYFLPDKIEINPGSAYAVKVWVRQQRDKMKRAARKKQEPVSYYGNIVSSLVNTAGFKYDYTTVLDLHISQFLDAFYRTIKTQDSHNVTMGVYSGGLDPSKINKEVFNWFGPLNVGQGSSDNRQIVEVPAK